MRHSEYGIPLNLKDPPEDDVAIIQQWANDLIRVAAKFGSNLLQDPTSIYRLVPPFCPRRSMIGITYSTAISAAMSVRGLSFDHWDDCLATVSSRGDRTISKVLAAHEHFLTLTRSTGTVVIWNAETCEEERNLQHREYVSHMVSNRSGTVMATAGVDTYRIWDISTGKELHKLPVSQEAATVAIALADDDAELVIGRDDCSICGIETESA